METRKLYFYSEYMECTLNSTAENLITTLELYKQRKSATLKSDPKATNIGAYSA